MVHPLDSEIETPSFSVAHFDLIDILARQEPLNRCIVVSIRYQHAFDEMLPLRIGIENSTVLAQVLWVARILGISLAALSVDKNRTGEGHFFYAMERIISEKRTLLFSDLERA